MSQSQSWQPENEKRSVSAQVIVLNVLGIDKMGEGCREFSTNH